MAVAKKKTTTKAVAKTSENKELAAMFDDDAGMGFGNIDKDDILIPYMSILQSLSPEVDEDREEYIEGAKPGLILNKGTEDLLDGIRVVPVAYFRRHLEWKLRENGGGLVADHGNDASVLDNCTRNDKGQMINPDGNEIVPTGTYYVLVVPEEEDGTPYQAVISMAKTQLKKSKRWMTLLTNEVIVHPEKGRRQAPIFYRAYDLSTVKERNDSGSWYGWKVEKGPALTELGEVGAEIYAQAKSFLTSINEGSVKVQEEEPTAGTGAQEEGF